MPQIVALWLCSLFQNYKDKLSYVQLSLKLRKTFLSLPLLEGNTAPRSRAISIK